MTKQLLTVGDSFTYGDELADPYQAWPYKLANRIGYEVHNMGLSGCSNASILRRTLEELAQGHYDLVVVGWTIPGRIEWKDGVGIAYNVWPGYSLGSKLIQEHPWRQQLVDFISEHHSPEFLYQNYLIQVLSLQSYCQQRGIDLLMLDVEHRNYYRAVGHEQHDKLEQQINTEKFVGWGKFGMRELTRDLPRGPGNHPLEKGHERIANEIAKHIGI